MEQTSCNGLRYQASFQGFEDNQTKTNRTGHVDTRYIYIIFYFYCIKMMSSGDIFLFYRIKTYFTLQLKKKNNYKEEEEKKKMTKKKRQS